MFKCLQMISITLVQSWCQDVGAWVYNITQSSPKDWSSVGLVCSAVFFLLCLSFGLSSDMDPLLSLSTPLNQRGSSTLSQLFSQSQNVFFFVLSAAKSPTVSHFWIKSNQKSEFSLWACSCSMNFKRPHVASGRRSLCRGLSCGSLHMDPNANEPCSQGIVFQLLTLFQKPQNKAFSPRDQ